MAQITEPPRASPLDPFGVWDAWARSLELHAPLSGAVNQAIQAALLDHGAQLGLVNISTAAAGDPALEQRIVEDVASYGRQLGWVLDALDALIRAHRGGALDAADDRALDQLEELRERVEDAKRRAATERVDRLVDDIRALRTDPDANAEALAAVRAALVGD